jgi:hypothetical protein
MPKAESVQETWKSAASTERSEKPREGQTTGRDAGSSSTYHKSHTLKARTHGIAHHYRSTGNAGSMKPQKCLEQVGQTGGKCTKPGRLCGCLDDMRSAITEIFGKVAAGQSALAEKSGNALGDNGTRNEAGQLPQWLNVPMMLESHSGGRIPHFCCGGYLLTLRHSECRRSWSGPGRSRETTSVTHCISR